MVFKPEEIERIYYYTLGYLQIKKWNVKDDTFYSAYGYCGGKPCKWVFNKYDVSESINSTIFLSSKPMVFGWKEDSE